MAIFGLVHAHASRDAVRARLVRVDYLWELLRAVVGGAIRRLRASAVVLARTVAYSVNGRCATQQYSDSLIEGSRSLALRSVSFLVRPVRRLRASS